MGRLLMFAGHQRFVARRLKKRLSVQNSIRTRIIFLIFIVAPYILIYVEFTHQQMHLY